MLKYKSNLIEKKHLMKKQKYVVSIIL